MLGLLALLTTGIAAGYLLYPVPLADVFFAGWVMFGVGLALAGAVGAWTDRTALVWVAALLLTGLSIAGMWSIGRFVAPAALFLLGSALLARWAGPREEERDRGTPPTTRRAPLETLAGVAALVGGAALVYAGALSRDLFGACARETLACVLGNAHWGAIGLTGLGLAAAGLGGWLLRRRIEAAPPRASDRSG